VGLVLAIAATAPTPSRADVFVTEAASEEVSHIDAATGAVTTIYEDGQLPVDVLVLPPNHLLVAEQVDTSPDTGRLVELDGDADWAVVQTEDLWFAPTGLYRGDDGTLYVGTQAHGVMARGPTESDYTVLSEVPGEVTAITGTLDTVFVATDTPTSLYRIDPFGDPASNYTWLVEVPNAVSLVPSTLGLLCGTAADTIVSVAEVFDGGAPYTSTLAGVAQPFGFTVDAWGSVHVAHREPDGSVSSFHPSNVAAAMTWAGGSDLSLPGGIAWDPACNDEDLDGDGFSECAGDCDDADNGVNPAAPEQCDGRDADCDGWLGSEADEDMDGSLPCSGDCDDYVGSVHPGAEETCGDGVDQDCDGADLVNDVDQDGSIDAACGGDDCDDNDSGVHPGAGEACDDGVDQDCDGADLSSDQDGDGFNSHQCGGDDCDDEDPGTHPGVQYECEPDVDNNCNGEPGESDLDRDGYDAEECGGDDCDDQDGEVNPGQTSCALEVQTGRDYDCDGVVQEGDRDGDGELSEDCGGEDCDDEDPNRATNLPEVCNGIDDNCDGRVDDGFGQVVGEVDCDPRTAPGFAVPCSCEAAPGPGLGLGALLLAGLLGARRRRTGRTGATGRRGASAALLMAGLLAAPQASAQDEEARAEAASRSALAAFSIHQQWCADAAGDSTTTAANALAAVGPVYADVSATYDETGDPLLLYWRGLLGTCMGQGARALDDLRAFEAHDETAGRYPGLVRDARRRVARGERRQAIYQGGLWDTNPWPTVTIGAGAGGQALTATLQSGRTWAYITIDLEVSLRIVQPLRFVVLLRPGISGQTEDASGDKLKERSVLPEGGVGLMLRAPGPIRPTLALFARFAGNGVAGPGTGFLGGPGLRLGLEFPFGRTAPLAVRVSVDAGLLASPDELFVPLRAGGWLVLALGRPPE